jgi:urease accessory protein
MLTISKIMPQGQGLAKVLLQRATTIELDWEVRQKSRFEATDSAGRQLGVFLPRGSVVRGGDVLVAEDGSLVRVQAAPQDVLRITACTEHGSPFDLTRAAYHLGNRHVPIELQPDHLKIEPDHVLADMLRAMHLIVTEQNLAFEPEGGAYAAGHGSGYHHRGAGHDHGHDQHHGHDHDHSDEQLHSHAHDHGHSHDHSHTNAAAPTTSAAPRGRTISIPVVAPGHVHGPHCNHDH